MGNVVSSAGLSAKTMEQLDNRRDRILNGGVNCIPSKYKRFRNDFCGPEQSTYYVITSFTKGSKTQFVSDTFIFSVIVYLFFAKEDIDAKFLYFNLEETKERIMQRFMSWLLFKVSHKTIRVSPKELRSTISPVDETILDRLRQDDVQQILEFFEEHIIFPTEAPNPTGIYKYCKQYAEEHGTTYTRKVTIKDELGQPQEIEVFDHYEQDNPNEYRFIVIDTINLIDTERGMNLKQSIDKLSEYLAKYLRNRYHYSPIVIQQQAFESEGNDAFKLGRVRPSAVGLGDSKYTSRDANVTLGLFSPFRFGITEYLGYDISILKDRIRFLEVITNRDGEMGGILPLWFDGAVCDFQEMPKSSQYKDATPADAKALADVYKLCATLDATGKYPATTTTKPALLLSLTESVKHIINFNKF